MTRCCWACVSFKDMGAAAARAIVDQRERHGPYAGTGDLGAAHRPEAPGGGVPGDGRNLRCPRPQPTKDPVGALGWASVR